MEQQKLMCPRKAVLSFPPKVQLGDKYMFYLICVTENNEGNFTWCYEIRVDYPPGAGRGLSNFILELCPDIRAENISNVTVNNVPITSYEVGNIKIEPPSPEPSLYGIKIEYTVDRRQSVIVCFDIDMELTPLPGDLVIKVGGGPPQITSTVLIAEDAICAPVCPPVPGRGIGFKWPGL